MPPGPRAPFLLAMHLGAPQWLLCTLLAPGAGWAASILGRGKQLVSVGPGSHPWGGASLCRAPSPSPVSSPGRPEGGESCVGRLAVRGRAERDHTLQRLGSVCDAATGTPRTPQACPVPGGAPALRQRQLPLSRARQPLVGSLPLMSRWSLVSRVLFGKHSSQMTKIVAGP